MPRSLNELITPRPAGLVAVDGRTFPLERVAFSARARGGFALTTVTQHYRNPHDETLEVVYTLPLPADGAVIGYTVRVGERTIRGEVQRREDAQQAYQDALVEGRIAGLLEEDRDDTFTQRLGSLPPGALASVTIEVLHPLAFQPAIDADAPCWEYRFPSVIGVRYEGAPGRVPDAGRLDVDRGRPGDIPTRLEFQIEVGGLADEPLELCCPSHAIACERDGAMVRARIDEPTRLDRDVVVRWNACARATTAALVEGPGLEGDCARYGMLTITPPRRPRQAFPRDLTILIDASGSMHGAAIAWAKRIAADLLDRLGPADRFEVLAFANAVVPLTRGLVHGLPHEIAHARHALDQLETGGGTEMADAVEHALRPRREDAQRQVVLLTDGYIGFEAEVIRRIAEGLAPNARLHVVGIGSAPNRALTRAVARAGRGVELLVSREADAAGMGRRLVQATAQPILMGLTVGGDGVRTVAPARPRDVFAGMPAIVALELAPQGGTIEVRAHTAGSAEEWIWRLAVPAENGALPDALPLGALFGRECIADLELELAARSELRPLIESRIEDAGLRHRIASRRTSLVAIAEESSSDPSRPRRRERLAVEMPAWVSPERTGLVNTMAFGMTGAMLQSTSAPKMLASDGASLRSALPAKLKPIETHRIPASWVRFDGRRGVIEIRAPFHGFSVPTSVQAVVGEQLVANVAVVTDGGGPNGPYKKGTVVLIMLELVSGRTWQELGPVTLVWKTQRRRFTSRAIEVRVEVPAAALAERET